MAISITKHQLKPLTFRIFFFEDAAAYNAMLLSEN